MCVISSQPLHPNRCDTQLPGESKDLPKVNATSLALTSVVHLMWADGAQRRKLSCGHSVGHSMPERPQPLARA